MLIMSGCACARGQVVKTDLDAGLLVEVAPHIRALVPVIHMSDLGNEAARKKFKVQKGSSAYVRF